MSLIRIDNWPAFSDEDGRKTGRVPGENQTWQFIVREELRRHVLDADLPGINQKEMVHVIFGPGQIKPVCDKTLIATADFRVAHTPEDPLIISGRLASFLGNALKERLDDDWRTEIFIHLHIDGVIHSGFWAG